jgi:hypothetical protein
MIYIWHTGHQINEKLSLALHAGIPESILKHTEWADNYIHSTNKHVAVGYGILRGTGDIFKHNTKHKIDYWEVDRGYINPNHFEGYYRISKNGLQAVYQDKDLPSDRLDKLKYKRENWFNPKGKIIVCPPTDYIEKYYGLPEGDWLECITKYLDTIGRPYKVRTKDITTPLDHDLQDAYCVVTFNSNVAVDATIKGLPVITDCSILNGWNDNQIGERMASGTLEPQNDNQVDKLLRLISYNQFTLEEIRNGTAWRQLNA